MGGGKISKSLIGKGLPLGRQKTPPVFAARGAFFY
jgi:hypothetical protein